MKINTNMPKYDIPDKNKILTVLQYLAILSNAKYFFFFFLHSCKRQKTEKSFLQTSKNILIDLLVQNTMLVYFYSL